MQLTLFTDYGLRSLMYLAAKPEELCSVREIAEHYGISRNHLVKIIHKLAQLGYITSTKGKGGGVKLAVKPSELKLGQLVKQLEPMSIVECFDVETNTCKVVSSCQLKHYLNDASRAFIDKLNQHSLADAVKDRALFFTDGTKSN